MISLIVLGGVLAFFIAYQTYARYLERVFDLQAERPTPAHTLQDGRDYFPAKAPVLLGHHFSSIAGAGPIIGPVFATLVFGWAPAVLWIVIGAIFIGGVHDFGSLVVSLRFQSRSIAQVAQEYMGRTTAKLLLIFIWAAVVYVLVVFLDLTAATYAPRPPEGLSPVETAALVRRGGGVASSSLLFILLALALSLSIYRFKVPLSKASFLFVPLVFLGIWVGQLVPILSSWFPAVNGSTATTWSLILIGYCFVASVTPVWILLQPRDYLSSFLLLACLAGGLVGVAAIPVLGDESLALRYPAFLGFDSATLGYLYPSLFITIACGACSGFHSIVASGTTAKQLDLESHARLLGYGAMLLEGVLALLAVATTAFLAVGSPAAQLAPPQIFAAGLGRLLALLGLSAEIGHSFGLLALSTFLLTTLDTCTRLGRYVLEELLELKGEAARWIATSSTLFLPFLFNLMTFHDPSGKPIPVWKIIWPVFGATNQLLGGLALLIITVWLRRTSRPSWITAVPMVFMITATMTSLVQLAWHQLTGPHGSSLIGVISAALFVLALVLMFEAGRALRHLGTRG